MSTTTRVTRIYFDSGFGAKGKGNKKTAQWSHVIDGKERGMNFR
jgi:hypothetical protein